MKLDIYIHFIFNQTEGYLERSLLEALVEISDDFFYAEFASKPSHIYKSLIRGILQNNCKVYTLINSASLIAIKLVYNFLID